MKWIIFFFSLVIVLLIGGCFAPVNSYYDSARMLDRNESRIGVNYTRYYSTNISFMEDNESSFTNYNNNIGLAAGYGLSEKLNLNVRYEYLKSRSDVDFLGETFNDFMNYFEIGCKIRLIEEKMALGLPLGLYIYEGGLSGSISPRLFMTFGNNEKVEFTAVPSVLLTFGDDIGIFPGVNFGVGLSNNLNKWAIRPEIGYNGCFNFGVGTYLKFSKVK